MATANCSCAATRTLSLEIHPEAPDDLARRPDGEIEGSGLLGRWRSVEADEVPVAADEGAVTGGWTGVEAAGAVRHSAPSPAAYSAAAWESSGAKNRVAKSEAGIGRAK